MYNVHEHCLLSVDGILGEDIIPEKGGQCSFYFQLPIKSRFLIDLNNKKQVVFDTTFLCIGEIIFEDGIEKTYDSLPADEIIEYLNIFEKFNIIKYDPYENRYHLLASKNRFLEICKCIPDSFSSYTFDSATKNYVNMEYDNLTGLEFEDFCAHLLSENGFENIVITPASGDHGIDVLAEKKEVSYAIQCKCYSSNIGNSAIQQAHTGKSLYHKDIAVVMTNRYFTPQAVKEASVLGVKLWDRDKLDKMIKSRSEKG